MLVFHRRIATIDAGCEPLPLSEHSLEFEVMQKMLAKSSQNQLKTVSNDTIEPDVVSH
jgi:hypothetical protein